MSVTGLASFNASVTKITKDLPRQVATLMQQKTTASVYIGAAEKTPVDTGHARRAWMIGIGEKPKGEDETEDEAELGKLDGLPPFSVTWVANNVNYIGYLEHGTDRRGPVGMIARTMAELTQ